MKRMLQFVGVAFFMLICIFVPATVSAEVNNSNTDVNNDWSVDVKDIAEIAQHYNTVPTSQGWKAEYDVNEDQVIDLYDITAASKFIGQDIRPGNSNSNLEDVARVCQSGQWIYYSNPLGNGELCKVKVDGTERTRLGSEPVYYIAVLKDWVYYINSDDWHIYRIKTDGSQKTRLTVDNVAEMNVYGDWIVYTKYVDNGSSANALYMMKTDGSSGQLLTSDYGQNINILGDWVYYTNVNDNYSCYKIKLDGGNRTRVINTPISSMVVYNNYIYYLKDADMKIYRTDLSGNSSISVGTDECHEFNISDGWIFYTTKDNMSLYKMKLDGTSRSELDNGASEFINVCGNYIYYYSIESKLTYSQSISGGDTDIFGFEITAVDDINYTIGQNDDFTPPDTVKAKLWGTEDYLSMPVLWYSKAAYSGNVGTYSYKGIVYGYNEFVNLTLNVMERGNSCGNLVNGGYTAVKDEWVYYSDINYSNGALYKKKPDGTGRVKLSDDSAAYINIVGDWLYYVNQNDKIIYKIKTDGTGRASIGPDKADSITVIGEYIYYKDFSTGYFYRMKTDGSGKLCLISESASCINVNGRWIYYLDHYWQIKKVGIDGSSPELMSSLEADNLIYDGGYLYYIALDTSPVHKMKDDGTGDTLLSGNNAYRFNLDSQHIYYSVVNEPSQGYSIYSMMKDGSGETKLDNTSAVGWININGSNIFYLTGENQIYKMKNDGSSKMCFDYTVLNINDIDVSVHTNDSYSLPKTVTALIDSGEGNDYDYEADVSWDNTTVDTSKAGTYTYLGTVSGYETKVKLNLTVIGILQGGENDQYLTVNANDSYSLPASMNIKSMDGTYTSQAITWDKTMVDTSRTGITTYQGTINGTGIKFNLYLNVIQPEVQGNSAGNLYNGGYAAESAGWFYFKNSSGDNKLYKSKWDGATSILVDGDEPSHINVDGDWIYYINLTDSNKLYKVKTDGTGRMKISEDNCSYLIESEGWLYYGNNSDGNSLYKINTDGTARLKISDDSVGCINVRGSMIIYSTDLNGAGSLQIFRVNTDGTHKVKLMNDGRNAFLVGNWIYYIGNMFNMYKLSIDGSTNILLSGYDQYITESFNVSDSGVYYSTNYQYYNNNYQELCKIDSDSNQKTTIVSGIITNINVVSDWICYKLDDGKYYKIKTDGTLKQAF